MAQRRRKNGLSRRQFLGAASAVACSAALRASSGRAAAAPSQADLLIYGATPSGLAAAVAATREGISVIVVEPSEQIGGLITGGVAVTDTSTPQFVGGLSRQFFTAAGAETRRRIPTPDTPSILFHGKRIPWNPYQPWDLYPRAAKAVFEEWATRVGGISRRGSPVAEVNRSGRQIVRIRLADGSSLSAKMFIDASYEGDLMNRAGVSCTYGRESTGTYGETLAGRRPAYFVRNYSAETYRTPGWEYMHNGQLGADIPARDPQGRLRRGVETRPLPPVGAADQRVQSYCFRLVVTQRPELMVPWPRPERYDPARYELLLLYIQAHPGICFSRLIHLGSLPGGKFDFNASGPFSTDYLGGNEGFPGADYATRARMTRDHDEYQKGYLWFLAHDPRLPSGLRDEVNSWGLCRDEWPESGNWPRQLYIREARRMVGQYVMTENDILRNPRKDDSVGMGSFVLDSHWVDRFANEQGFVRVEGHLDESIDLSRHPYDIPYRCLTPKPEECPNLLVPVCVSASHVAYCTIRMEPVYMILGHSAGVAAALAIKSGKNVQAIDTARLLGKLRDQGQVLHPPTALAER